LTVQESVRGTIECGAKLSLVDDPSTLPWRQVLGRSPARLNVCVN
jgi:hypothetical protein